MDSSKITAGTAGREFFLIHGYTAGTGDFSDLPEILKEIFKSDVYSVLLPGHETNIDDLLKYNLDDFINHVETKFLERRKAGKKIILVGISFGAQLALYLSSKYDVSGVIIVSMIHKFKFPLNLPGVGLLGLIKKKWKKWFSNFELESGRGEHCYHYMPSIGFSMTKQLARLINRKAVHVQAPILSIYSTGERLANYKIVDKLFKNISSKIKDIYLLSNEHHSLFFSPHKNEIVNRIVAFVRENDLFNQPVLDKNNNQEKATAIVPSYNEAPRIANVLKELQKSDLINEIIVVDDASIDDTASVVANFPKVRYLKNEKNMGKAYGMDRGVKSAKNDLIFFCDADLIGFKREHAEEIIRPVMEKRYDMYIGVRGNFMQRTVKLWSLNSGERALRKNIWHNLPEYYKYRYRIEAGLNYYVSRYSRRGMGWKMLDYSMSIKEQKYGFIKGFILRNWMNLDVFCSYIAYPFVKKHEV